MRLPLETVTTEFTVEYVSIRNDSHLSIFEKYIISENENICLLINKQCTTARIS